MARGRWLYVEDVKGPRSTQRAACKEHVPTTSWDVLCRNASNYKCGWPSGWHSSTTSRCLVDTTLSPGLEAHEKRRRS